MTASRFATLDLVSLLGFLATVSLVCELASVKPRGIVFPMGDREDRLGEGFYKGIGLVAIRFHVPPEIKQRVTIAGVLQKPKKLSLDKMCAKIVQENIHRYEVETAVYESGKAYGKPSKKKGRKG